MSFSVLLIKNEIIQVIVCTPLSPLSAGGEGGASLKLQPNFQKGGLDRTSAFKGRLLGKRGVTFFWGRVCNFHIKNRLKSEIFNDKKCLWAKIFFSVITKDSNWKILTKILVTLKDKMVLRDKNFDILDVHWKNLTFRGGHEKPI